MSKCILVVEDQEDNRQILRDFLDNAGYQIVEVGNGEEAVAAVATQRFDPIGYAATRHGRLRGYAADQVQSRVEGDSDYSRDLLRPDRR
jgi:CheY-like chemotaxis protein